MSKNEKNAAPKAQKLALCANDISPNTAMMHVIATNLMTIAFADVPDAEARLAHARYQILSEQPNVTLSMRRSLERSQGYLIDSMNTINSKAKKYH